MIIISAKIVSVIDNVQIVSISQHNITLKWNIAGESYQKYRVFYKTFNKTKRWVCVYIWIKTYHVTFRCTSDSCGKPFVFQTQR